MKTQVKNMFMNSEVTEMEHLTNEAEDRVVATGVIAPHHRNFCAADLWNIQKMRKLREPRKMFL